MGLLATKAVDGGFLYWPQGLEGRISKILQHRGRPLTVSEICEVFGPEASEASVRGALSRLDAFVKVSNSAWALSAWGVPAFEGIASAIRALIVGRGGQVPVSEISVEIAEQFGVQPHSVTMISEAPCFKVEQGRVMIRPQNEPYRPRQDLHLSRGLFLRSPSAASLLLEVTRDMLRGSGTAIPESLGEHLGILPGTRKNFSTATKTVLVSWPDTSITGPSLGTIREELIALGVESGDMIRLDFSAEDMQLEIQPLEFDKLAGDRDASIRATTGLSGSGHALYESVAQSLKVPRDAVRGILVRREDRALASWFPPVEESPGLQKALDEFARAFSES
jgi:hypothetical protein